MVRKRRKSVKRRNGRKMPFSVRFGILVTILVLIVAAAAVLMAPGFKVSEVYCEGNSNVKSEEIFSAAQIEGGKNIFLIGIGKAERNVNKLPMVKNVNIRRVFPDKICINIEERVPLAYIRTGGECVAIDEEMIVVKKEDGESTAKLVEKALPDFEKISDDKKDNDDEEEVEQTENDKQPEQADTVEATDEVVHFSIPLIEGVELKSAEENKKAKCDDEEKIAEVIKICAALNKAELLGRSTYLNVTDMQNINLVIENRLDIRLGNINNIEYRTRFLSEVINTKISAYETLILDYTGDDIYARAHDDGKDRIKIEKEDTDDAEDEDDTDNSEDTEDIEETEGAEDTADNDDEDDSSDSESETDSVEERESGVMSL